MAKVMISLPDDLLKRIDAEAARRQTSRSGLLAQAAEREIDRRREEMEAAVERLDEAFKSASWPPYDAAEMVRRERDSH